MDDQVTQWTWRQNAFIGERDATTNRADAEASVARCRAANPGQDVGLVERTVTPWRDAGGER